MRLLRLSTRIVAVAAFFVLATVLLLADRATALVAVAYGEVIDAGRRIEQGIGFNIIDRSDIPATFDQIGHVVLWCCGMLVVGVALRHQSPLWVLALFVSGVSLLFEYAQPALSSTRAFEYADAVGNIVGVAIGTVLLGAASLVSRVASMRKSVPQRQ